MEAPAMVQNVDLFTNTVVQMLQRGFGNQSTIDELRSTLRSVQSQVVSLNASLEDLEDRLLLKLQNTRPVVYTREGVPLDDALDSMESRLRQLNQNLTDRDDMMKRLEFDLQSKLDIERFETAFRETKEDNAVVGKLETTVMELQKELQRNRTDQDGLQDNLMQMVALQIKHAQTTTEGKDPLADGNEYVTRKELNDRLKKLGTAGDPIDLDDIEGSFQNLQARQKKLADDMKTKGGKSQLETMVGEVMQSDAEDMYESDELVEFSDDFEVVAEAKEAQFRDVSVDAEGNIETGDSLTKEVHAEGTRRNIAVECYMQHEQGDATAKAPRAGRRKSKKQKPPAEPAVDHEPGKVQLISSPRGRAPQLEQGAALEARLRNSITRDILARVEMMLMEMMSTGFGAVKLGKADAATLIKQLDTLNVVKTEVAKLRAMVSVKYDRSEAEEALNLRVTREELFEVIAAHFTRGATPVVVVPTRPDAEAMSRSRSATSQTSHSSKRPFGASGAASTSHAKDSRFISFNKRYCNGSDGRYYLRDQGPAPKDGGSGKGSGLVPGAGFDFQPFGRIAEPDRLDVPHEHRAKTPPHSD
jgi:hypothetical protein